METLRLGAEDKLHSADSAAALLGIRPSTIRWWWVNGKVRRVKIGRLSRVPESDLLAMIALGSARGDVRPPFIEPSPKQQTDAL